MSFPAVKRYFLRFRKSDTGLTPTFIYFQRADTFANVTPPTIFEKSDGTYYFDYTWTTATDPDLVFCVDGGASIPTEEVRYISGSLSPKDIYFDAPISTIPTLVWGDSVVYAAGTKGLRLDNVGDPTDNSAAATMFGKSLLYKESVRGDSAGTSDGDSVKGARDKVMGGTGFGGTGVDVKTASDTISATLASMSGAGFVSGTDSLKAISAAISVFPPPDNASIAAIKLETDKLGDSTDLSGAATVFGQVYASRDNIKGGDNRDLTQIAGTGFVSGTMSMAALRDSTLRLLGMLHENSVLDNTTFDTNNNLTYGRLRLYDSKANADAAQAASPAVYDTGKIAEYVITATYTGSNLNTYEVARVA